MLAEYEELYQNIIFQRMYAKNDVPGPNIQTGSGRGGAICSEAQGGEWIQNVRTGPGSAQSVSDLWRFCLLGSLVFFKFSFPAESLSFL